MDTDINFLQFITSKPIIFVLVVAFQLFILFKDPLKTILTAWSRKVAKALSRPKAVKHQGDTPKDCPILTDHVVYPKIKGLIAKSVSVFDVSKDSMNDKQVHRDQESEIRSRFAIFYLKDYKEITVLMSFLVNVGIELLSTTVIFKSENKEVIIFYVSYYGHKLTIQDKSQFTGRDILHG